MSTVGLISPGAMGASVGAAAAANQHQVVWAGDGRSQSTHDRAERAGLTDCNTLDNLVGASEIILSVCPPGDAVVVAQQVAELGFRGTYLEGNAVAPNVARRIAGVLSEAGASVVDGGIVGGPAWKAEFNTRLYLSGDRAQVVAELFEKSPMHTRILSDEVGAASALKLTFAAYTKGSTALLAAILAVAEREGVREYLEEQWGPEFAARARQQISTSTAKAWRFVDEMREIAATFEQAGMPGGFHHAAGDVFERLASYKDFGTPPSIEDTISTLLER